MTEIIDPTTPTQTEAPQEMPLAEVLKILADAKYGLPAPVQEYDPRYLLTREVSGRKISAGGIHLAEEEDRMALEVIIIGPGVKPDWCNVGDEVHSFRNSVHQAPEVNRLVYGQAESSHNNFCIIEASTSAILGIVRKGKT